MANDKAKKTPSSKPEPALLRMLVCPVTRQPLEYDAQNEELISQAARLAYPIREGVPVMVAEAARKLEDVS